MVSAGLLAAAMASPLQADYLINTDLSDGIGGWHGDGEAAYLKANGTEGDEGDPGITPVIKLPLSKDSPRTVYQDFETRDHPKALQIKVEIYASSDFKRSTFPSDYTPEINWQPGAVWYWSAIAIPNVDFWLRAAPGYSYKTTNLLPKNWVTVAVNWDSIQDSEDRTINFCVPPGDGVIYIKNPSATP
jgi:hypothetical protein